MSYQLTEAPHRLPPDPAEVMDTSNQMRQTDYVGNNFRREKRTRRPDFIGMLPDTVFEETIINLTQSVTKSYTREGDASDKRSGGHGQFLIGEAIYTGSVPDEL